MILPTLTLPVVVIVLLPNAFSKETTLLLPYALFASAPHEPFPRNTLLTLPSKLITAILPAVVLTVTVPEPPAEDDTILTPFPASIA